MNNIFQPAINQPEIRMPAKRRGDSQRQLRYLTSSIALEETVSPHLVRNTMLLVSGIVSLFVIWATYAPISEVSRAMGEIVPSGNNRVVQHLDGGMISQILVKENQLVKQGDLLFVLDGTGAEQDASEVKSQQKALALQMERLNAFLEHRQPNFSSIESSELEKVREIDTFNSMLKMHEDERSVIESQIVQKRASVQALAARQQASSRNLQVNKQENDVLTSLRDKQLITAPRLLESSRRLNDTMGDIATTSEQISEAQAAIGEYTKRLSMLDSKYRDDAYQQLHTAQAEFDANKERFTKLNDRADRLQITAPVSGLIKGLQVTTIGSVIHPGETLAEIVPVDDKLEAEVRIDPKDVGHVAIGDAVRLKVSAYDFVRYGALDGTVESISAASFTDAQQHSYFRGRIALKNPYMGADASKHPMLPGMTVEGDIIIGKKTILQYLLKPIDAALSNALTEK